jgi:hypothetical protein
MTGKAADLLFENITPASKRDLIGLVDILAGRFGSEDYYAHNAKKLRNRKKQEGEPFKDYAQDLTLYAKRMFGYYADPELLEKEVRHAFIRGLPDNLRLTAVGVLLLLLTLTLIAVHDPHSCCS